MAGQLKHLARAARAERHNPAGPRAGRRLRWAVWGVLVGTADAGQQSAHRETGVQGMTVIEPALVRKAARQFEMLRSDALPWSRSLDRSYLVPPRPHGR